MKKQKQLIRIVVITIVGLILMGVGIHLFSLLNKTFHPLHLDTEKVHKITILSYDDERNAALSKAAVEKGESRLRILCEKSDQPYRVSVIEPKAREEIANTLCQISATDRYFEKKDIQNEKKDYEVICYDVNGKELQKITFYGDKFESKNIYELDAPDEKAWIQNLCEKYNTPWIDDSYNSYMQKRYASKHNIYNAGGEFGFGQLFQTDLKGGKFKAYDIKGIDDVLGVTKNKIIYKTSYKICYVPYVSVEGKSDEIKYNEIVEICEPVPTIKYVDSRYMMGFYKDTSVFIYDFESNREIATTIPKEELNSLRDGTSSLFSEGNFMRCGTDTFMVSEYQIHVLKEGKTTWEKVAGENDGVAAWNENTFIYSCNDLYCYDVKNHTSKKLVNRDKLYESISPKISEKEWENLRIRNLFLEGNTLYVQMENRYSGEKDNYFFCVNTTDGKITYREELSKKYFCYFLKDGKGYMTCRDDSLLWGESEVLYDFKKNKFRNPTIKETNSIDAYDRSAFHYHLREKGE